MAVRKAGVDAALASLRKATNKEAIGFAGDLSDAAVAEALVQAHPGIEILVNNLGIFEPKPFEEIPDADWRRFFEINVLSGARLAAWCCPPCGARTGAASSSSPAKAACRFRPR
jgi:NAD(P)-dependent dehydrogenase (short-subunit alcohol dehydrogenase family)